MKDGQAGDSDIHKPRMPMFHPLNYPRLPLPASSPKQRKPGLTKTPSYTSSPIGSPSLRSPANVSRKRANAISLAGSPARQGHSNSMTRIFERSRETVRFQEEARKRSVEEKKQINKENQAFRKTTAERTPVAAALPGLPALSPLSRPTDDMPAGLLVSTLRRVTPSKPLRSQISKAASKTDYATTPHYTKAQTIAPLSAVTLSPVETWLSSLPDDPPHTPSRPNTGKQRSSTEPLSPSAKTHRLCASASSIAERIQMRTPSFPRSIGTEQSPVVSGETDQPTTSLLSRLLKPAARPIRKDSGVWASAKPTKVHDAQQVSTSSDDGGTISAEEEASDKDSTPSDSGSSDVLHLPKLRHNDTNAVTTPKSKNESKSHDEIRNVTPEVAVFRKGKGPKKSRCTSYFDQDVIAPLKLKPKKDEGEGY